VENDAYILGIDLSPRDTAAILARADGGAQLALRGELPRGGAPEIWLAAMETARETLRRAHVEPAKIIGAGIAFDAPVAASGVILKGRRTVGWEGFDLPRAVREHLGVAHAVAESRTLCEALGEWRFGALREAEGTLCPDWLYVHLGDRLGGAAALEGRVLRGANRAAVALGALCLERDGALCDNGRRGSWEGYCGVENFLARARSYGLTLRTAREIWDDRATNFVARSQCDDYVRRLAQGLGNALSLLNPRRLVLGGPLALDLGDELLQAVRPALGEFCSPTTLAGLEICPPQLGADAAALGAVALALAETR
jgi:predicted NBD/HSP70 family sugar kinase